MYKYVLFLALLCAITFEARSQSENTRVNDQSRIALTAVVPNEGEAMPPQAKSILLNRLRQLATGNGYGGSSIVPQFIIAANPVLIEKKVAGTAPTKIWVELELTLFIADQLSKTIFSTGSVLVRGVGATDTEAYMDAYKGFNIQKSEIRAFAQKGREEILAYYNTRCDFIMSRVDMLVNTNQADAALEMLMGIPEVSKSCFDQATAKAEKVYLTSAEQRCQQLIQAARTAWSNSPNRAGADKASSYLSVIPPQAKCNSESNALLAEIKTKMLETEQWERSQYRDQLDLMRRYIQALRDVGVAYGEGQPDTQIQLKGWLW